MIKSTSLSLIIILITLLLVSLGINLIFHILGIPLYSKSKKGIVTKVYSERKIQVKYKRFYIFERLLDIEIKYVNENNDSKNISKLEELILGEKISFLKIISRFENIKSFSDLIKNYINPKFSYKVNITHPKDRNKNIPNIFKVKTDLSDLILSLGISTLNETEVYGLFNRKKIYKQ